MKNHLSQILLMLLACLLNAFGYAQPYSGILKTLAPVHPRLFASDKKIADIKLQKDAVTQQLLFIIKADADKKLGAENILYPDGKSNMEGSRTVQGRIISLALAYRLTGDQRYFNKAKSELMQLSALKEWGLAHFLDVGEAALAAGIGLDWLYNDLNESERKTIADAIIRNALLPSLELKESPNNSSWVNGNFNWNPVCHGGLIVGALAIAEREPELSKRIIDRGIKNIPIAGDAYSPDGAFAEGPSYWSYGTSFYVMTIEALRTALGSTSGLEKIPGFLKTADFDKQMEGPTGQEYNFSDYHHENLNEPILFWFAKEVGRYDLAADEISNVNNLFGLWKDNFEKNPDHEANPSRHTPLEILWWQPSLLKQNKNKQAALHWTAGGLMPIGVMRSAWNDARASFAAIKGGTPNNSHGHMDAGSFILEANGVRWALDLGTESYDKMRAAKLDLWNYGQNSNRWSTFRCGPEGHNILRFNNHRQLIIGSGQVKALHLKNGSVGNQADLTTLYADDASQVLRTLLLHPNRTFTIKDEWTTKDSAVTYCFQWLTKAKVIKNKIGLLLEQNGQSLQLKIDPSVAINEDMIEVQDVSAPQNLQDSPNLGLSRILIKIKTAAHANGQLVLRAIPISVSF